MEEGFEDAEICEFVAIIESSAASFAKHVGWVYNQTMQEKKAVLNQRKELVKAQKALQLEKKEFEAYRNAFMASMESPEVVPHEAVEYPCFLPSHAERPTVQNWGPMFLGYKIDFLASTLSYILVETNVRQLTVFVDGKNVPALSYPGSRLGELKVQLRESVHLNPGLHNIVLHSDTGGSVSFTALPAVNCTPVLFKDGSDRSKVCIKMILGMIR
jgi:hypothetical protein